MKLPSLALAGILAFPAFAQMNLPPTDNFTLVTNLWFQGYKTNVLAMAVWTGVIIADNAGTQIVDIGFVSSDNV